MDIDHRGIYLIFDFDEYRIHEDLIFIGCNCNLPEEECWFNNTYSLKFHILNNFGIIIDKEVDASGKKRTPKEDLLISILLQELLNGVKFKIEKQQLFLSDRNGLIVLKAHTENKNPNFFEKNLWYIDWIKDQPSTPDIEKIFNFRTY